MWKQRRFDLREQQWTIAQKLLTQAEAMLAVALAQRKWTASDAAKYIDVAISLARQAAELHDGGFNSAATLVHRHGLEMRDTQNPNYNSDSQEGWIKTDDELDEFLEQYR